MNGQPHRRTLDHLPSHNGYARLNKRVAVTVTGAVGSMSCAWLFCALALGIFYGDFLTVAKFT